MNPRPRDYDSPALPLSYSAVRNAEPVGANARVIYGRVPRVSSAEPGRGRLPSGGGTVDPAAAYEARADVADTGLTGGNTGLRLVQSNLRTAVGSELYPPGHRWLVVAMLDRHRHG